MFARLFTWLGGLIIVVLLRLSFYTVDASEYAFVTVLGRHVATIDGATEAGLYFGWPWPIQMVQRLDRRLQLLDLPALELLTQDVEGKTIDKMLVVEAYAYWKIADRDAVELFVRRKGTGERARAVLGPRITSELGAVIGQMRMEDLINTATGPEAGITRVDATLTSLHQRLLSQLQEPLRREYGVELADIRLKRFGHPEKVRESIYARIRSEREKKVAEYESEGRRLARNIESTADQKVREMLADAKAEEEKLKGLADAEAIRIRNEAYSKDPEFYSFLKQMEVLQSIFGDSRSMLLLSTQRPIFKLLHQPPRPEGTDPSSKKEDKK